MHGDSLDGTEVGRILSELRGEPCDVILSRIFEGDPLQLQALVMRVLRGGGFLLDPDRCMQHSLEEIAFVLSRLDENDAELLDRVWLERCVDRACDHILAEDVEHERRSEQGLPVEAVSHRFLSEAFGITWGEGRTASVAFHRLDLLTRLTFFALCVDRIPAQRWAEQTGASQGQLREAIWDVFCALGYVSEDEKTDFRARG